MKELTIKLDEAAINNLKIFLSRTDLKGSEVYEFARILQAVDNASLKKAGELDG